jgi:DNA end-binding protein Ku
MFKQEKSHLLPSPPLLVTSHQEVSVARGGIWNGSISFGLLNIPVSLRSAEESKDLHFNMLDEKDFSPIKFRRVNANTGAEVPYNRIVKGYEYESGDYVVLNKADFTAANPKATQTIDIEDFVLLDEIDTMLFEKPYYLVPNKSGVKGYFLLRDALRRTGKVAIGKIVIRTKQHLVGIMPRGEYLICEILRFPHEIRAVDEVKYLEEVPQPVKYNPRELKMAEELIEGMTEKWHPRKYKDTYYDDLMKRIKIKIKEGRTHAVTSPEEIPLERASDRKVVDLLPLLRKSLEMKKRRTPQKRGRGKRETAS